MGGAPEAAMEAPEAGNSSSAGTLAAESQLLGASWDATRLYRLFECKVGRGSESGNKAGFLVHSDKDCLDECCESRWCKSFSLDTSIGRCYLLGKVHFRDCRVNYDYKTWELVD